MRLHLWALQSAAYRSLSPPARCVLVELMALYNGSNNGEFFLSVREAARRVGIGKTTAANCFRDLIDRGFIRIAQQGAFNLKATSRRGDATAWLLTEFPPGDEDGAGTRDFMYWKPPASKGENQTTVRGEVRAAPESGRCSPSAPV